MKNLKVNECFFHGVRNWFAKDAFHVLDDILRVGSLLTTSSLREHDMHCEREVFSYQGDNAVSICFHPDNKKLYDQFYGNNTILYEDPAFKQFVNIQKPGIVLKKELFTELPIRTFGGYQRMSDEVQVTSNIPLSYMVAISYGNDQMKYLEALRDYLINHKDDEKTKNIIKEFLVKYYYNNDSSNKLLQEASDLNLIEFLLKQYGYKVPIINPVTGHHLSLSEYEKILKKSFKLVEKNEKHLKKLIK